MIAIITARGGSKGLPGKNVKMLRDKPLIAYTIEAALQSRYVDRVIVNTDDEEIADAALQYGADIPFMRPAHLASDTARSIDVLRHTLDLFEANEKRQDEIVLLQPTSPLRSNTHIDEAITLFRQKEADAVISVTANQHPIFWSKYLKEDQTFEHVFEDKGDSRQAYKETYLPNGAIYVLKARLITDGNFYTPHTYAYVMERSASVDIDTIEDFEYCEFLMRKS